MNDNIFYTQVAAALLSLRQRNTYHGNPVQSYPKSMENGMAFAGAPDLYNLFGYINPESGSQVIEVIETSKCRAKMMVNVAIQVCSSELFVFFSVHVMLSAPSIPHGSDLLSALRSFNYQLHILNLLRLISTFLRGMIKFKIYIDKKSID